MNQERFHLTTTALVVMIICKGNSSVSVILPPIIVIFRPRERRHAVLHQTATLPDGLCDVWPGLLLCQDLTASANIRPVRPVRGPGEEGRIHHDLQGLLRPRHADGLPYLTSSHTGDV